MAKDSKVRLGDLILSFDENNDFFVRSNSGGKAITAGVEIADVLAFCGELRTKQDFVNEYGSDGGRIFDELCESGILVSADDKSKTPVFFGFFGGLDVHRKMLGDEVRLRKYLKAIRETVKPGDVVIDAGAGTGILSLYAAKAGASKVYSIENGDMGRIIPRLAKENGVDHIIELVPGNFAEVQLPEKADVLVTETFGFWVIDEGALPDIKKCVENNLKPGGKLIPFEYSLYLAPVNKELRNLTATFSDRFDNIKMDCLLEEAKSQSSVNVLTLDDIDEPVFVGRYNIQNDFVDSIKEKIKIKGPCKALCAYFTLHLSENVDLSNSPEYPKTSWSQGTLPVELKQETNHLSLEINPSPENSRAIELTLTGDVDQVIRIS